MCIRDSPLIGRADWNDCLNLNCFSAQPGESFQTFGPSEGPVAESVFIGGMFVKYGEEYAQLAELQGLTDLSLIHIFPLPSWTAPADPDYQESCVFPASSLRCL